MGIHAHHKKPEYKSPPYSQHTHIYSTDAATGEVTFVTVNVTPTGEMSWAVRAQYHSAEEKPDKLRNVLRFHTRPDAMVYGERIASGQMKRETVETLQSVYDSQIACDIWDAARRRKESDAWERGRRPTALQRAAEALAANPAVIA